MLSSTKTMILHLDPFLAAILMLLVTSEVSALAPSNFGSVPTTPGFSKVPLLLNRRNVLLGGRTKAAAAAVGVATLLVAASPSYAAKADLASSQAVLNNLLQELRSVPTFCIVDKDGAAYMLYQQDQGNARGYAFTTFQGALAVLADAKRTAEEGGYADVWQDATITIIPADIAVRLALQPRERISQKDQKSSSIVAVIPGINEREAGIQIDSKFKDQSKVPLFFFEGLKLDNGATPLYFNPNDLLEEWKQQNNGGTNVVPPRIQVLDLVTMFQYVLRGRADELPVPVVKIKFVPSPDTLEVAARLKQEGLAPYKTDRMIV